MMLHGGDLRFIETEVNYAALDSTIALVRDIESEHTDAAGHDI